MKDLIKQLFRFGIVGIIAFLIDFFVLYIFTSLFQVYYLLSSVISFTISTVFNYYASVKWVFDVDEHKSKQKNFITFIIFSLIGLALNQLIMWVGVDIFCVYYLIVKIISTAIVMVFNFVTRKIFLE